MSEGLRCEDFEVLPTELMWYILTSTKKASSKNGDQNRWASIKKSWEKRSQEFQIMNSLHSLSVSVFAEVVLAICSDLFFHLLAGDYRSLQFHLLLLLHCYNLSLP